MFALSLNMFIYWIGPYQVLPFKDRVDPGNNGNDDVLRIPLRSSITGVSPLDWFMSYPEHLFGKSHPSAEMRSMYSTAPVDWATVVRNE